MRKWAPACELAVNFQQQQQVHAICCKAGGWGERAGRSGRRRGGRERGRRRERGARGEGKWAAAHEGGQQKHTCISWYSCTSEMNFFTSVLYMFCRVRASASFFALLPCALPSASSSFSASCQANLLCALMCVCVCRVWVCVCALVGGCGVVCVHAFVCVSARRAREVLAGTSWVASAGARAGHLHLDSFY